MTESWSPPGHTSAVPVPIELQEQGACVGVRGEERDELFWPPDSAKKEPNLKAAQAAVAAWDGYCKDCPVLERCFDHAVENEEFGVWAGTIDFDRRRLLAEYASTRDPELMEFARNRLRAGYIPFPRARCNIKGCERIVRKSGDLCSYHRGQVTRRQK